MRAKVFEKWRAILQDGPRPTPRDNMIGLAVMYEEHYRLSREAAEVGNRKEQEIQLFYRENIGRQLLDSAHRIWEEENKL